MIGSLYSLCDTIGSSDTRATNSSQSEKIDINILANHGQNPIFVETFRAQVKTFYGPFIQLFILIITFLFYPFRRSFEAVNTGHEKRNE